MAGTLLRWVKRYGPAEIAGTITVYIGYYIIEQFSDLAWLSAYVGALSENIGFYGVILIQRFNDPKEKLWHVFAEFGPAEFVDSLFIRPVALFMGVYYLGPMWGLLIGKIGGDILFYGFVIICHEILRKFIRPSRDSQHPHG